jgi:hypothetical protein
MAYYGRSTALAIGSIDEFKSYLRGLNFSNWRPSGIVQHNTASPTLEQWWHSSTPPEQRVQNLISYYRDELGWSSCPHAFVDGVTIWVTCDFNVKGVHSPSWNGTRLGIEMVADYDTESDESGEGKAVLDQSTALFGECCTYFGWDVDNNYIKQHKEDPETTHDCPGKNVVKSEFLNDVTNYIADGGEDGPIISRPKIARLGIVTGLQGGDTLNIRASSSSSAPIIGTAVNGDRLRIIGEAMNGSTKWLRCKIGFERGPGIAVNGWASSEYISIREEISRPPPHALNAMEQQDIMKIADNSDIAGYYWDDRGTAPNPDYARR